MSNWTQNGYDPSVHGWKKGVVDGAPYGGWSANYFFADTLRSVDIAFGLMLHGISVFHTSPEGEPVKQIEVPIKIGPRAKAFDYRVEKETGKKYYIPLPNITYRRTGMQWDNSRAVGRYERRTFYSEFFEQHGIDYVMQNKFWSDIQPIPYKLTYEVNIKAEYQDDLDQLNEQLTRLFEPDYHLIVKEFWFAPIRRTLKVTLDSISYDYPVDFDESNKREFHCNMTFTVEAWLYKPIKQGAIIDQIITKLSADVGDAKECWQHDLRGNFNGSLTDRHNFSEVFGTKIDYAYKVRPESTVPVFVPSANAYVANYQYDRQDYITNYPRGSRLLVVTSAVYNDPNDTYGQLQDRNVRKKVVNDLMKNHPLYSGCKFDSEIYPLAKGEEGASGFNLMIYKDMEGFGEAGGDYEFGHKDVDLGTEIVKDAPFASKTSIVEVSK